MAIPTENMIGNVDFTLPRYDPDVISIRVRIFEQGQEIDYVNRTYTINLLSADLSTTGRGGALTNELFRTQNNEFRDLPNGEYRVIGILLVTQNGEKKPSVKEVHVTVAGKETKMADIRL